MSYFHKSLIAMCVVLVLSILNIIIEDQIVSNILLAASLVAIMIQFYWIYKTFKEE